MCGVKERFNGAGEMKPVIINGDGVKLRTDDKNDRANF